MTPERIEELKKLCAEATPGPWKGSGFISLAVPGFGEFDAKLVWSDSRRMDVAWLPETATKADQAFIASVRTVVPELIAEVERLRGLIKEAEQMSYSLSDNDDVPKVGCPWCTYDSRGEHENCSAFTPDGEVK